MNDDRFNWLKFMGFNRAIESKEEIITPATNESGVVVRASTDESSGEENGAIMIENLEMRLELLGDYFQWVCDWNKKKRDEENMTTDRHTAIICVPPHWPTHGTMSHWIETIREAQ